MSVVSAGRKKDFSSNRRTLFRSFALRFISGPPLCNLIHFINKAVVDSSFAPGDPVSRARHQTRLAGLLRWWQSLVRRAWNGVFLNLMI